MEIRDLKLKKLDLESEIKTGIATLVKQFQTETGTAVNYVDVDMTDVSSVGKDPIYIVGQVKVDIQI